MKTIFHSVVTCALLALAGTASAQPADVSALTHHVARIAGEQVAYTASVRPVMLAATATRPAASIVPIAYVRDGKDQGSRPVTFIFNGGPGSSSSLLHMLAFGPRRVEVGDAMIKGQTTGEGPHLVDNQFSLLDKSDLVMIDPVGTGFSHAVGGNDTPYFGVNADAEATADVIHQWLADNGRTGSPVHILSESYGATRAVKALSYIQSKYKDMKLGSIIMVSGPLDYVSFVPALGDDKAYPFLVPSMAAAAWYHNSVPHSGTTFDRFIQQARDFGRLELEPALSLGSDLPEAEKLRLAQRLAHFTGVPASYFAENDLRVRGSMLPETMLKARGLRVGRYDSRFTGPLDAKGDPSSSRIGGVAATSLQAYLTSELGVDPSARYHVSAEGLKSSAWRWDIDPALVDGVPGVYLNLEPLLAREMAQAPGLRVFMATGYFDMICPFMSIEHTATHVAGAKGRITLRHYQGGHMMYATPENLAQLSGDIHQFLAAQ